MNKRYEEFLERLLAKRQIPIFGRIDRESFEVVSHSLAYLARSNEPVTVLIKSHGGSVEYGLYIYDALATFPVPVRGVVVGYAHSMAAVALQGCMERIATMNATICLHNISTNVEIPLKVGKGTHDFGDLDIAALKRQVAGGIEDMRAICRIFVRRSGLTREKVVALLNEGKKMNAKEAFCLGLLDKVVAYERTNYLNDVSARE